MAENGTARELRYYDALRSIAKGYMPSDELRRKAEKMYGLSYEEALEMAYDNVLEVAKLAIEGRRRPKADMEAH